MKITLKEGDSMPMWYACAYFDYWAETKVVYPIGIHVIVRYARKLYAWIVWIFAHKDMERLRKIFEQGYEAGYRNAVKEGPTIIEAHFNNPPTTR